MTTSALYSAVTECSIKSPGFQSQPRSLLSWLWLIMVLLSPSRWMLWQYVRLGSPPCPCQSTNHSSCPGSATAQAVNYQRLKAEDQVQLLARWRGICAGQRGTGTGFSLSTWSYPSILFHQYTIITHSLTHYQCYMISATDSVIKTPHLSENSCHLYIIRKFLSSVHHISMFISWISFNKP